MSVIRFLAATIAGALIKVVIDTVQVAVAGMAGGAVLGRGRQI